MKTDEDILDDVLLHIKESGLMELVNGKLDTEREDKSLKEDVIVAIEANENGEKQEAFVSVDVFVSAIMVNNQWRRPRKRLKTLCKAFEERLALGGLGKDFRLTLDNQRVEKEQVTREYKIYNRLLYQTINE